MKEVIESLEKAASLIDSFVSDLEKSEQIEANLNKIKKAGMYETEEEEEKWAKEFESLPTQSLDLVTNTLIERHGNKNKSANDWGSLDLDVNKTSGTSEQERHQRIMNY